MMSDSSVRARSLINHLTYDNAYRLAVSEVTGQACDVLALRSNGEWVEFEIKTSRSDLRKELRAIEAALVTEEERKKDFPAYYKKYYHIANTKIAKHSIYLRPDTEHSLGRWKSFIPDRFYFAVTDGLEEYAVQAIKDSKLPYGVTTIYGSVLRNAKKLESYIDYQTLVGIACRAFGEEPPENKLAQPNQDSEGEQ